MKFERQIVHDNFPCLSIRPSHWNGWNVSKAPSQFRVSERGVWCVAHDAIDDIESMWSGDLWVNTTWKHVSRNNIFFVPCWVCSCDGQYRKNIVRDPGRNLMPWLVCDDALDLSGNDGVDHKPEESIEATSVAYPLKVAFSPKTSAAARSSKNQTGDILIPSDLYSSSNRECL